jgi:hypothetical protein
MKAKLKKERDGDYTLTLNNPKEYPHSLPLLSKQNCDEIFGVIDVEKLAEQEVFQEYYDWGGEVFSEDYLISKRLHFIEGFNKAMELNKDKQFTLEQVIEAMTLYIRKEYAMSQVLSMISELPLDSEMDVEIEMELMNIDEIREQGKGFLHGNTRKPKLDENGCLILKKIR